MQSTIYSNVGFRCESAYKELNNYLSSKKINELVLQDSKKILNDCLRIENDEKHSLYLSYSTGFEVESILYDYIREQKDKDILVKLKKINTNLENLDKIDISQIKELCTFFKNLVAISKDKAQYVSKNDNYMIFRMC